MVAYEQITNDARSIKHMKSFFVLAICFYL